MDNKYSYDRYNSRSSTYTIRSYDADQVVVVLVVESGGSSIPGVDEHVFGSIRKSVPRRRGVHVSHCVCSDQGDCIV